MYVIKEGHLMGRGIKAISLLRGEVGKTRVTVFSSESGV
jgi:hypothetical protein